MPDPVYSDILNLMAFVCETLGNMTRNTTLLELPLV